MREGQPPSSPKKQQLLNRQNSKKYVDSKTSTSRKAKMQSKLENVPEQKKQQMRKRIKELRDAYKDVESMPQPEVYVFRERQPVQKKQQVQVRQSEKPYKAVVQHSQPQALPKGQSFVQKGGAFLLKKHEKSYQTLQNKYQQAKPQKKQKIHEEQKPSAFQQAAQNHEDVEKVQVKSLVHRSKLLLQSQIPQRHYFYNKYQPFFQQKQQKLGLFAKRKHKYNENQQYQNIYQEQEYFGSQQPEKALDDLQKNTRQSFVNHKFSNLSNFQILKIILQQELQKNYHILQEFIYDISNLYPNQKKLKENQLARLLQKVFIKKMTEQTSQVIDELKKMADQLCKSLLVSLSEQVQEEYLLLTNQYNQKYQKNKKLNKIPKNLNKFMDFMKKYPMNPYMAIKLDLLSYFLINNIDYEIEYCRLPTDVVIPYIISKILTIDIEEIEKFKDTIEDKWNYVSMDHYEHFRGLIIITTLVALRQKVENNEGRKIDLNKQRTPLLSKFTRVQQDFTFKFSRLAFETEGMLIKTYCTSKRLEIIQISKKIVDTKSQRHKKWLIIHTKSKYIVSINQLITLIHKIEHQHEQFLKQYQEQMRLQEGIKDFPWYFYSPKSEVLKNALRKLSQCSVTSKQIYDTDNYFATALSKMMVQRIKELSEFTSASIKWLKKRKRRTFIFVSRFEYSYNRLQRLQEKDDLVGTLIIGTTRGKIVFTSFIERDTALTDAEYVQQLKTIFHQKLKMGGKFGVLLYQFAIRNQFDPKEYASLRKHFWNRHRAIIMAANLPNYFYLHFMFDLHISKWGMNKDLVKTTFFDDIRKKIRQTAGTITKALKA